MDNVTQFLVIITAASLLLAACAANQPSLTPTISENQASPTLENTPAEKLSNTPTVHGATINPTIQITPGNALVITQAMNGNSFNLKVGETFEIQLATIPVAGFEWTPKDLDTAILLQQGHPVYQAGASPNSAGGIVTLKFKAVGAGTTHLTLLYLHPAGNGLPSLYKNSFGVNFAVK
jgi:predicted secreted protein